MSEMLYPIGVQSFDKIRNGNYVYVDKTEYIWKLTHSGNYYFLSRPRRFGKSLLQSTIQAYFEGRRELFKGLAIERMEKDWLRYPVLHLDLNAQDYTVDDSLFNIIDENLDRWEKEYDIKYDRNDFGLRFSNVIKTAHETTGRQVVILIDEYDKPLLMNLSHEERQERFRNMLKGFYGVLKSCDRHIKFALLTGVTKFGRVSVFSDLNNLNDISLNADYNEICGISESELAEYFGQSIRILGEANGMTEEQTRETLRLNYDGYHFTGLPSEGMYNPYSLLNVFYAKRFGDFWFINATPTFLIDLLKKARFDLSNLPGSKRDENALMGLDPAFRDPVPVIFQSGFLTISGFDRQRQQYILDFPNREVEKGFLNALLPYYANRDIDPGALNVFDLRDALDDGDVDTFMRILISFMAGIPFDHTKGTTSEARFHDLLFLVARLIGLDARTEYHTALGSIDMVVFTPGYIYVMEFKVDRTPATALRQIDKRLYDAPFVADSRKVVKVGVQFSTTLKNIKAWKAVGLPRRK